MERKEDRESAGRTSKKLRVLHVVNTDLMRGAERFAQELCSSLDSDQQAHEVIAIHRGHSGQATESKKRAGARLRAFRDLVRAINDKDPAVIFCHGLTPLKWVRLALIFYPFGARRKIVFVKIGMTSPWISRFRWVRLKFAQWAIAGCRAAVVLGPKQKEELVSVLGMQAQHVHLIPNARRAPVSQPEVSRKDDLILMVGALESEKNPELGIRILNDLVALGAKARLRLVGEGSQLNRLHKLTQELGIESLVEFTGSVSDVYAHYCEATLLLLTSTTEGVPGVIIEAMFCGLPVVAWDVGDVAFLVRNSETGLVTAFGDEEALLAAVADLMRNKHGRAALGVRAKERSRMFDMNNVAHSYRQLVLLLNDQDENAKG